MKNNYHSRTFFLPLFITLLFSSSSFAITHNWLGGNGSWLNPAKWDTGLVPVAGDEVIIPTGICRIKSGQTAYAQDVEIQPGAKLVVKLGGSLYVENSTDGNAINNDGTLLVFGSCVVQNVSNLLAGFQSAVHSDHLLKIGTNGSLQIINTDENGLANYGSFRNNGTLSIEDYGNYAIHNYNIFENNTQITIASPKPSADHAFLNFESVTNAEFASLEINNTNGTGYANSTLTATLHNYGQIDIVNSEIQGLRNSGEVYNYESGTIYSHTAQHAIYNYNLFENEGSLTLKGGSYAGVGNTGQFNNHGHMVLSHNEYGINNYNGNFVNYETITSHYDQDYAVINGFGAIFTNDENGFLALDNGVYNDGDISNSGVWLNHSEQDYYFTPWSTFINYGIFEDDYDVLPATFDNQQIVIRRLTGTLQAGVAFSNPIEVFSSSNFNITSDWTLNIQGDFAGIYDEATNTFTPDAAAVDSTDIKISIEMISTGFSRLYTLHLDQAIVPFQKEDLPQFALNKLDFEIQIFPNPTIDQLTFVKNDNKVTKCIIYNTNGQALKTVNCDQSNTRIDIPKQWTDGLYILSTYSNSSKKLGSQTFTIQR